MKLIPISILQLCLIILLLLLNFIYVKAQESLSSKQIEFVKPTKDTISIEEFTGRKGKKIHSITVADGMYKAVYFYNRNTYISQLPVQENVYVSVPTISRWYGSVSFVTIPFKVRPPREGLPQNANVSIKSVGLMVGPYMKTDRYFANGKVSRHKWSVNLILAPASEEFNPDNTRGNVVKSNQLVLSVGGGISYTYNSLSAILIPLAYDFGLTKDSKHWIYNKKYWFGFGLAIDSKFFGF